jgi:starch-binding outer membrane protein, SusD/RagB family
MNLMNVKNIVMSQINKKILRKVLLLLLVVQAGSGCRKFVEIGTPPDKISQENVFSTDRSATSVLTGIYSTIRGSGTDMAKYSGLLADEWTLWTNTDFFNGAYYTNNLRSQPGNNTGGELWVLYFNYLFRCNAAIEGLSDNKMLTPSIQQQLLGEAYFMRAWFYFYLVNLYGDLPLVVGTDPEVNRLLHRSPTQAVYELIEKDLLKAESFLSSKYLNGQSNEYPVGSIERVRPTKWAASALLARAYLYMGDYPNSEIESSKVIANTTLFTLLPLNSIFLKNSQEAVWQTQPGLLGWNTQDAMTFHLSSAPIGPSGSKPVHLSQNILNAFETNDQRKAQWVGSRVDVSGTTFYFPMKYKIGAQNSAVNSTTTLTEYSMMLRLGEQYLIRAEARARQNNISGAIADLDIIRNRANLPLIANTNPGISQTALLDAILHEKQVELFTEWGHRWFDLKRTRKVDGVMSVVTPQKGGNWESTDQLLPIPYNELLYGVNLKQNPGY